MTGVDLKTYTSFLEKIGEKMIWSDGVPFYSYRPGFLWSVPQFASYEVKPENLKHLVWSKTLGVIYTSQKYGQKQLKFWVYHGQDYDVKCMQPETRRKTRRGLERCEIRQLDWDQLGTEGLSINIDALRRQKRESGRLDNAKWWNRLCRISSEFSDVKAWGAFVEGNLVCYTYVVIHDNILVNGVANRTADIVHTMSHSRYLKSSSIRKSYPNEALIYFVMKELMEREQCTFVVNGQKSSNPSLEAWKRWMGYVEYPVLRGVVINPILNLAIPFIPRLRKLLR